MTILCKKIDQFEQSTGICTKKGGFQRYYYIFQQNFHIWIYWYDVITYYVTMESIIVSSKVYFITILEIYTLCMF